MSKVPEPSAESRSWLAALNFLAARGERHVYGGTVPPHVTAKRRARNRVARQSRRINRGK